ncbi:MAG: hypothetical protein R3B89_32875 [Polyangiaceae bacterium]
MSVETGTGQRLERKFASFSEHCRPKVLARLNGQELCAVKTRGVFPWHRHADSEEFTAPGGVEV